MSTVAETPLLDALASEQAAVEQAEDLAAARAEVDVQKRADAEAVLVPETLELLLSEQAKVEAIMRDFISTYVSAARIRNEVFAAVSTLTRLGDDPPTIPAPLYLKATVGGNYELRQMLDEFRALALAAGEI